MHHPVPHRLNRETGRAHPFRDATRAGVVGGPRHRRVQRRGPVRLDMHLRRVTNLLDAAVGVPVNHATPPSIRGDREDPPPDRRAAAVDGQDIHDALIHYLLSLSKRALIATITVESDMSTAPAATGIARAL